MSRNVSFNFATAISKFDTFSSYHIVRTRIAKVTNFLPFCTIGISMYQKSILPYFVIPSTFSLQASSPFSHHRQTDRRTTFFTPCYLSSFFSLSTWGPTRWRNSTGLAELWGGWPIEREFCQASTQLPPQISSPWCSVCLPYGIASMNCPNQMHGRPSEGAGRGLLGGVLYKSIK